MAEAYVTLATNDGYAVGALVLAHSLRSVGSSKNLVILITPQVSPEVQGLLRAAFTEVLTVNVLDSNDSAHLALLKRPELGVTFTKLHAWNLVQYSKCVFLDADMLAVKNPDDLFSNEELTACCDVGWPDCFNSGMFVFKPSNETYDKLIAHAEKTGSFDGGDQGLLNTFFPDWKRVSFVYNMVATAVYSYLPAYKQYGANARLVHFLGSTKPWQVPYNRNAGAVDTPPGCQHISGFLNSWWAIYMSLVQPECPEVQEEPSSSLPSPVSTQTPTQHHHHHHQHHHYHHVHEVPQLAAAVTGLSLGGSEGQARWERGEPEYAGRDSFANIQAYIDQKLKETGKK